MNCVHCGYPTCRLHDDDVRAAERQRADNAFVVATELRELMHKYEDRAERLEAALREIVALPFARVAPGSKEDAVVIVADLIAIADRALSSMRTNGFE